MRYNGHESDLVLPRSAQIIIDSDTKWAEGAKPMNVTSYILFLIKKCLLILDHTANSIIEKLNPEKLNINNYIEIKTVIYIIIEDKCSI